MADIKDIKLGNTKYNIKIPSSRVKSMADYAKPSSKPSPEAIQQSDTLNAALGKLEYKADTNQTNILYALNTGVKNLIVCNEKKAVANGLTITRTQDGIQISGTATASFSLAITGNALAEETQDPYDYSVFSKLPSSVILTGAPDSVEQNRIIVALYNDQTWIYSFSSLYDMPQDLSNYNYNRWYAYIPIVQNKTYSGIWKPMLRDASISDDTFVPGALPNSDLTYLEAEDRAALAEEIDAGAKNLLNISNATFGDRSKVTFNSDGSVTGSITDDTRYWSWANSEFKFTLPAGRYVLYCVVTSGTNTNWGIALRKSDNSEVAVVNSYTGKDFVEFTLTSATEVGFMGKIFDRRLYAMVCTKAAFGVSQKFAPYCKPLASKTDHTYSLGSVDLNEVIKDGTYMCSPTANSPVSGLTFIQVYNDGSYDIKQVLQKLNEPSIFYIRHRRYSSTSPYYTWTSWYKFTGQEVT